MRFGVDELPNSAECGQCMKVCSQFLGLDHTHLFAIGCSCGFASQRPSRLSATWTFASGREAKMQICFLPPDANVFSWPLRIEWKLILFICWLLFVWVWKHVWRMRHGAGFVQTLPAHLCTSYRKMHPVFFRATEEQAHFSNPEPSPTLNYTMQRPFWVMINEL